MAVSTTSFPGVAARAIAATGARRRRSISPQDGRALEILGHAIDYLADELVHEGNGLPFQDGRLQAIQLLMAANRRIYFACPEIPGFWQRFLARMR